MNSLAAEGRGHNVYLVQVGRVHCSMTPNSKPHLQQKQDTVTGAGTLDGLSPRLGFWLGNTTKQLTLKAWGHSRLCAHVSCACDQRGHRARGLVRAGSRFHSPQLWQDSWKKRRAVCGALAQDQQIICRSHSLVFLFFFLMPPLELETAAVALLWSPASAMLPAGDRNQELPTDGEQKRFNRRGESKTSGAWGTDSDVRRSAPSCSVHGPPQRCRPR